MNLMHNAILYNPGGVEVTRKSDQKNIVFPVMFNHTFNDDGEIVRHFESWDRSKLQ